PVKNTARIFRWAGLALLFALVALSAAMLLRRSPTPAAPAQYIQLTNFADSATSPALSPDGRLLTFIRGPSTFFSTGQIYVKPLPDGEPVQLTDSAIAKMGPQFSPDGTRISYATGIGLDSASMD